MGKRKLLTLDVDTKVDRERDKADEAAALPKDEEDKDFLTYWPKTVQLNKDLLAVLCSASTAETEIPTRSAATTLQCGS